MRHLDPTPAGLRRPTATRRRVRSAVAVAALMLLGAVAGCSGSGQAASTASSTTSTTDAPRSTTSTAPENTTTTEAEFITEDDCVSAEEVGEVVGAPVDLRLSFGGSGGTVSYSYQGCGYDVGETDGSVSMARLRGEGIETSALYDALESEAAKESDEDGFERIDDLGDEAYRDGRDLVVLHGPQVLLLGYSPTGGFDDHDPDKALRVAMAVLPVDVSGDPIDCDVLGAALVDEFGPVDQTTMGSGIDGVNDATLEYQNCTVTFDDGSEAQVGVADAAPFAEWVAGKKDSMFSATFDATSVGELQAFDNGDELFVDDGDQPLRVTADELDLTDEEAAELRISLAELALGA